MANNVKQPTKKSTAKIARDFLARVPSAYIFPIRANSKQPPLFKNELELAFNDTAAVDIWAKKSPGCNWGLATKKSGLIVMDVDDKPGKVGSSTLFDLEMKHDPLPTTLTVRTPSGGKHIYFKATRAMMTRKAGAFGPDIDATNYVLIPGCVLDGSGKNDVAGEYKIIVDAPIADAPAWFLEYLDGTEAERVEQVPEVEQDTDAIRARCIEYLTNDAPLALQGRNGDATTLRVFGVLKDMGASVDLAVELAAEYWNDRCEPPWSIGESADADRLDVKARNAYGYLKQNAPGSATPEADFGDDPITADDESRLNKLAVESYAKAEKKKQTNRTTSQRKRGIGDNSKGAIIGIDLSMVKPRNVDFIWPGRLAKGKQTAFAGEGGIGKSQITMDMAARITNGSSWPDVKDIREAGWPKKLENAPRGFVVVLSAEDDTADTILPRLIAAGGNPKFVRVIDGIKTEDGERKFSLQDDLAKLKEFCIKLETDTGVPVQLIIIDPASSYMGGAIDASKNTAVRSVLDPITTLARDLQCAIVSVTHFRKGSSPKAVEKVMDSVAFVNAPRVALGAFRDPSQVGDFNNEPSESFVFTPMKTNLPGKRAVGLSYRIEEVIGGKGLTDERDKTPIKTSRIVWQGKTDLTADEISQMESERGTPKLNEAVKWVREILPEDVPVLVKEVTERAEEDGIARGTLLAAKRKLRVVTTPPVEPGGPRSWVRPSGARTGIELEAAEVAEAE